MAAKSSARTRGIPAGPIKRIYVLCHASDLWLAKISVASIRYWYPDVPITLLKDRTKGDFNTAEMERCWNISSMVLAHDRCGLGFAKIELLIRPRRERFLIVDADTVMCGPVLRATWSNSRTTSSFRVRPSTIPATTRSRASISISTGFWNAIPSFDFPATPSTRACSLARRAFSRAKYSSLI